MGVQLPQDTRICNLTRILNLELFIHLDPGLGLGSRQDSALHERVDHARLNGSRPRGSGTCVHEQDRAAGLAAMGMRESIEGKSRLGR